MAASTEVCLREWDDMIHDWHLLSQLVPQGREAMAAVGAFVREHI